MIRSPKILFPGMFLVIILFGFSSWIIQKKIADEARAEVGQSLTTVLDTTHHAVNVWLKGHKAAARVWGNTVEVRQAAEQLLAGPETREALLASLTQTRLRHWFSPLQQTSGYQGYFIIGPGNINLASSREQNVGARNLLASQQKFFDTLWSGENAVSLPERSDVPLPSSDGDLQEGLPTLFVGAPILSETGKVIALFTLRINPQEDFTSLLQHGRIGKTGETYAFDRSGRLISSSRYNDQLRAIGLIGDSERAIFNIRIRDPGVNLVKGETNRIPVAKQPLTRMAREAVAGRSGIDLDGYRDYRGVTVVGSWTWDEELGMGMTTELDLNEAYQTLHATQRTIMALTAIAILLLIGLTVIYVSYRQRVQTEVALRDSESRFRQLAEHIREVFWISSTDRQTILYVSPAYEEVWGQSMQSLYEQPEKWLGTIHPLDRDRVARAFLEGAAEGEYDEEFRILQSDGSTRWIRDRGFPVLDASGAVYRIAGIAEDITAHKKIQEALQKAQERLETRVQQRTAELENINKELKAEIAERKRIEQDLRDSEKQIRLIADNLPVFIAYVDSDLRYRFNNKAYEERFGLSSKELYGKHVSDVIGADGYAKSKDSFAAVLSGASGNAEFEYEMEFENIGKRFVSGVYVPDIGEDGTAKGFYALIQDITARKQAEKFLREERDKAQKYLDTVDAIIVALDREGNISLINRKGCEIFGYTEAELLSKNWFNNCLPQPEGNEAVLKVFKSVIAGDMENIEYYENPILTCSGEERLIAWHNANLEDSDGNIIGTLSAGEDITERKRAETELIRQKALFEAVFRDVPDAMAIADVDRHIIMSNPALTRVFGYQPDEIIGQSTAVLYASHEEFERQGRKRYNPAAAETLKPYVVNYRRKNGELFPGETVGTAIKDEAGETIGFIGVVRDITDRKRVEELGRQHQAELAHMSRLNTMGEMATGIAHELNQPLTAIATYADVALRLVHTDIQQPDKLAEALEKTREQAVRAGDIIRRVRRFVSKQSPQVKAVDLNALVTEVIGFTETDIKKRGVRLSLQLDRNLPEVMADSIQIEQVLLNLIRNSLEALQNTATDSRQLSICTARETQELVQVTVSDTGPGIDSDMIARVFKPFVTTKGSAGMGMGLSISRSIIEAHGGRLRAQSGPGKGAVFTFTLQVDVKADPS